MITYGMVNLDTGVIHIAEDSDDAVRRLEVAADLGIRSALVLGVNGRWSHLSNTETPTFA